MLANETGSGTFSMTFFHDPHFVFYKAKLSEESGPFNIPFVGSFSKTFQLLIIVSRGHSTQCVPSSMNRDAMHVGDFFQREYSGCNSTGTT